MIILDTNYILRWFLGDIKEQASIVDLVLKTSKTSQLVVDRVTIAEITYVLRSKGYDHGQIYKIFEELYCYPSLQALSEVDKVALEIYRGTPLDFEDCVLIAHKKVNNYAVGTFDKEILKLMKTLS